MTAEWTKLAKLGNKSRSTNRLKQDGLTWIWLLQFYIIILQTMASSESNIASQNEIVLCENEMVCSLTNKVVRATKHWSLKRQQMKLYEREIMCRHKTKKALFGESRFVIFFTLINIKNNEKRKILPLSFLRDWRGQGIWPLPRVVIRACSNCSTKLMTSIRLKLLTKANFISVMLMILFIAMSSTMPSTHGARMNIRRTTAFLTHY